MLGNKWSLCETFVLGNIIKNLVIMWPVFTAQSVTLMGRASIKSRFSLLLINTRKFEGQLSFHLYSVFSQTYFFCLILGSPCLTKCASVHCLPDLLETTFSIAFLFYLWSFSSATNATPDKSCASYRRFTHMVALPSIPSMSWLAPASGMTCVPGPADCPAAPGKWARRSERAGCCTPGRAQEHFLENTLLCRSSWLQRPSGMPCTPSASALVWEM